MGEQKHNLYVIAGCNGAGKTTASFTVLPEMLDCREFVNADEIAAGLSPFGTGRETGGQTRKRRWAQHPARCDLPPLRQRPK